MKNYIIVAKRTDGTIMTATVTEQNEVKAIRDFKEIYRHGIREGLVVIGAVEDTTAPIICGKETP
ncbi:MAG: hypothetical protein FWB93_02825 [Oscillospiraceae bacterium]|nr:hypothetical protein [Oscillospiraceae bacterium]